MIQKVDISEFLALAKAAPIFDVRSPGEFLHACIPGAHSLPLFSDEERKVVGTLYKQQGREQAIKAGLDYFGPKMSRMVEEVEQIVNKETLHGNKASKQVLVHCWRGGMRSAGVAWLLDLYGFKVYTLIGGYKSFRNWVLQQFEQPYHFNILGGYTGSGKTLVLKQLADAKYPVVDLEGIARHRGSAFGGLGETTQPTQEMFENMLGKALHNVSGNVRQDESIWLEDESRRIGLINLPGTIWDRMRQSPLFFLDVPFEERLGYITQDYGKFSKEELVNATTRIQKRLGGLNAKNVIGHLQENNDKEAFRILLNYYDKYYERDLAERAKINKQLTTIKCEGVNSITNSNKLTDIGSYNGITNRAN